MECGASQSEVVSRHVSKVTALEVVEIRDDLGGIPRVLVVQKTQNNEPRT